MAGIVAEEATVLGEREGTTALPSIERYFQAPGSSFQAPSSNNAGGVAQPLPYYTQQYRYQYPYSYQNPYASSQYQQPQKPPESSYESTIFNVGGIIQIFNPIFIILFFLPLCVIMYYLLPKLYDTSKQSESERIKYAVLLSLPIYIPLTFYVGRWVDHVVWDVFSTVIAFV